MMEKKWLCNLGQWSQINDPLEPDDSKPVPEGGEPFDKALERCQYKHFIVLGDDEIASGLIKVFSGTRPDLPPFMVEVGLNSDTVHLMYAANEPSMFMVLNLIVPTAHFDWLQTFEDSKLCKSRRGIDCVLKRGHSGACEESR